MIKNFVFALAFLASACITREVVAPPTAPAPAAKVEPAYHHAKDALLASKSGQGAKCTTRVSTPIFDSAFCELASGAQLECWYAQPGGMGCFPLYAPPPPQPAPQAAPPPVNDPARAAFTGAKAEAPKKK